MKAVGFKLARLLFSWTFLQSSSSTLKRFSTKAKRTSLTGHHRQGMADGMKISQIFDYFLVLDFEATCEANTKLNPQEIIEWPVLKVNSSTWETESIFHHYVQPRVHSQLTDFCTSLTGIIQDMVDNQPYIEEILAKFEMWMEQEGLLKDDVKFAFVTCGDWDLNIMLPKQCSYFQLRVPAYMKQWINIKRTFSEVTSVWPKGMPFMLDHYRLPFIGRHHSGIDDCRNIANILKTIGQEYQLKLNGKR